MEEARERTVNITPQVVELAQDGNANMQFQLANYLYVGDSSKPANPEQGFQWMHAAAENGSIRAQKILGLLYTNGQYAPWPEIDLAQAVYWYERAARAGDAEAMYWMYCCYNKGVGVLYDGEQASYWLEQAKKHGYVTDEPEKKAEPVNDGPKPWEQYDVEDDKYGHSPSRTTQAFRHGSSRQFRQETLEKAQDGVIFTPKHDMEYVRSAAIYGVIALSIGIIACCVIALLINAVNPQFFASGKRSIFLIVAALISLAMGAVAFRNAYLNAYENARKNAWFRQTPFFRQIKVDYDDLSSSALMHYEYYTALEKSFKACAYEDVIPKDGFSEYRGYMFINLFFGERGSSACPDFVIVTEKSAYVIECLRMDGHLSGQIGDENWQLEPDKGRIRVVPNPLRLNDRRMQIIKRDLSRFCPWVISGEMPFYSLVVVPSDLDTSGLKGEKRAYNTTLLKVSPEELRSNIEVMESKNRLNSSSAMELIGAIEQIAGQFEQRRAEFGKEML